MSDLSLRAPGRVNLIGEHTDYMHLPVLPMAIQRGVTVWVSEISEPGLVAASDLRPEPIRVRIGDPSPDGWGRYLHGALTQLGELAAERGAEVRVTGDLPHTGGLSSSSALTTGVLAALVRLWHVPIDDEEVVRRAIAAERTVGVESGGMDQTVIMFGVEGAAIRIDWEPADRTVVPIPDDFRFVIGYSGDEAPKGGSAKDRYNERVVSCRAAAALLSLATGRGVGRPILLHPFAGVDLDEIDLPESATAREVADAAGVELDALVGLTTGSFDPQRPLRVARAAHHVLTEANRVDETQAALEVGDIATAGRLFCESHRSLQSYGVSTPGLDTVTTAAHDAGAVGARLTGAGFGGWAVALCSPDRVDDVIAAMSVARGGLAFEVVGSRGVH